MAADAVAPTGDADRDKRMKKMCVPARLALGFAFKPARLTSSSAPSCYRPHSLQEEIEKLKKNQTRRLNRKKALADESKPATSRKCANCGAVGHMSASAPCPSLRSRPPTTNAAPLPRRDEPQVPAMGRVQPHPEVGAGRERADGHRYGGLGRGRPPPERFVRAPLASLSVPV